MVPEMERRSNRLRAQAAVISQFCKDKAPSKRLESTLRSTERAIWHPKSVVAHKSAKLFCHLAEKAAADSGVAAPSSSWYGWFLGAALRSWPWRATMVRIATNELAASIAPGVMVSESHCIFLGVLDGPALSYYRYFFVLQSAQI